MADIAILGSGGFGISLAVMCSSAGHTVTLWSKFQDEIDTIKKNRRVKGKAAGSKDSGSCCAYDRYFLRKGQGYDHYGNTYRFLPQRMRERG